MSDSLRERYEAVPYRHGAVPDSHPARLGAIGRLLGLATAAPDRCSVLEIGCGEGMNLLPLAERFPNSEFFGLDLSRVQIAAAERARSACRAANIRFEVADLREFDPEERTFDYIIAHGVYSWVPDAVKNALLALCSRCLAPEGIAYLSYNTLPGWSLLGGLRRVLLGEVARIDSPAAQLDRAAKVLEVLDATLRDQPGAYAALMREAIADMRQKPQALLFHDELAPVNDPCTFTEFVSHAARHGLHYLAEAHYATMPIEHAPTPMREALAKLEPEFLETQQWMDVIFQRWLRNSLLCRIPLPRERIIDQAAVRDCALGLRLRSADPIDLAPGVPMRFHSLHDVTLSFSRPDEKALLTVLVDAAPARISFAEATERANQRLAAARLPPAWNFAHVSALIYRLFALDALDLVLAGNGEWLKPRTPAAPSPLMRYQVAQGLPLTNRWHEQVAVTPEGARALSDEGSAVDEAVLAQAGLLW